MKINDYLCWAVFQDKALVAIGTGTKEYVIEWAEYRLGPHLKISEKDVFPASHHFMRVVENNEKHGIYSANFEWVLDAHGVVRLKEEQE